MNEIVVHLPVGRIKKSARALAALLSEIEVVADCPFSCDSHYPNTLCDDCRARVAAGDELPILVVLGSRGRSAVAEMLSGSTFENVVRQSRRPVLVVRGTECDQDQ